MGVPTTAVWEHFGRTAAPTPLWSGGEIGAFAPTTAWTVTVAKRGNCQPFLIRMVRQTQRVFTSASVLLGCRGSIAEIARMMGALHLKSAITMFFLTTTKFTTVFPAQIFAPFSLDDSYGKLVFHRMEVQGI